MKNEHILTVDNIKKSFKREKQQELLVLDEVNFKVKQGEIIAILGKSGAGKSTLLRIIAGLIDSTSGEVKYRGKSITEPAPGIAMVFQNFALLPWLTVLQNVELGLEALRVPKKERRQRALKAIDIIGLDGFESAYPKELSGGMRQRVGFARAIVVNPDILLMDEPFSSLDVLTSENLRGDLMDLWESKKTNTNAIVLVTHNIEEAATLADRILIFGTDPGNITAELQVELARPRNEQDPQFRKLVNDIYTLMTTKPSEKGAIPVRGVRYKTIGLRHRLPDVDISVLIGLIEELNDPEHKGKIELPELAESQHLDVDDLFPLTETLEILRFAFVSQNHIELTQAGKDFADADILERKKIFATHLIQYVPLARHIRRILDERPGQRASEDRFLRELEDTLSDEEAERVLSVAIDWARYAEIFAYDYNTGMLNLENPD